MPEQTIAKSLSKAYRQISIDDQSLGLFKTQLEILYKQIAAIDTEEKIKGDLMDFLKLTFYGRIISSVFCRSSSVVQLFRISLRLIESIIKASLHPVLIP